MPRRASTAGAVRNPGGGKPLLDEVVERGDCELGLVERQGGDPQEALILCAEVRHGPVVCARCGIAKLERLAVEARAGGKRRENELAVKAQLIERLLALLPVEGAQRLVALGPGDEIGTQRHHLGDAFGILPRALAGCFETLQAAAATLKRDSGKLIAEFGVGEVLEEVRLLHDVAIGIVERASLGVRHPSAPGSGDSSKA